MTNAVKFAAIIGAALIISTIIAIYFGSYQSCIRSNGGEVTPKLAVMCRGK